MSRVLYSPTAEPDRFLPEGPRSVRVAGREAIAWVNIQTAADATSGAIHVLFRDGERRRINLPARPGFLLPTDAPDTVFIGLEKAVGTLNLTAGKWTPYNTILDADPRTIINDGEVVPGGGAVVFGTKDTKFADQIAHLYLFTMHDNKLSVLADRQLCSNGKVIHRRADGRFDLFDIDTPTKKVVRYTLDVTARTATDPTTVIDLTANEEYPDGMCDGGNGTVIIAYYTAHRGGDGIARRYRLSDAKVIEEWTVPGSPRVTCPLLLDLDGPKLVLTTATEGMPADQRSQSPNAGSLFVADVTGPVPAAEWVRL